MTQDPCPIFLVQTENGNLHAYYDEVILRAHLAENPTEKVTVFSRHYGARTGKIIYTKASCLECFDHDEKCQECCPHNEHDHGICYDCGLDRNDELCNSAHEAMEGDR